MKRTAETASLTGINTLSQRVTPNASGKALTESLRNMGTMALGAVANYYSSLIDKRLSLRQTAHILNAQTAFTMTIFPVDCPLAVRFACVGWLLLALRGCKRSGLGE